MIEPCGVPGGTQDAITDGFVQMAKAVTAASAAVNELAAGLGRHPISRECPMTWMMPMGIRDTGIFRMILQLNYLR